MHHKKLILENNKTIDIYDDVFSMTSRINWYDFAMKSQYSLITWGDTIEPEKQPHNSYLHRKLLEDDMVTLGFINALQDTPIWDHVKDLTYMHSIINLSTPSDVNYIHAHTWEKVGILYYMNLTWLDGWHGETQFYSENNKEVQYTSPYTPGRVIVFDPSIPHTIRPQSIISSQYRFTLANFFA
jgi:hypothetical protein